MPPLRVRGSRRHAAGCGNARADAEAMASQEDPAHRCGEARSALMRIRTISRSPHLGPLLVFHSIPHITHATQSCSLPPRRVIKQQNHPLPSEPPSWGAASHTPPTWRAAGVHAQRQPCERQSPGPGRGLHACPPARRAVVCTAALRPRLFAASSHPRARTPACAPANRAMSSTPHAGHARDAALRGGQAPAGSSLDAAFDFGVMARARAARGTSANIMGGGRASIPLLRDG
ncbi:hypothetical protein B0H15DRAFT_954065 [Mycena belliarum]|uniref:Uncharacterized protein n=1 Tax=Mycena belliarum TaxID=1033014 RepID=A0AAD6XLG2_9AGAR|nr:hypothetical protein B0H15DRAFT_954065 [Mycena belliae]